MRKPTKVNPTWTHTEKEFIFDNELVVKRGMMGDNGMFSIQGFRLSPMMSYYPPNTPCIELEGYNTKGRTSGSVMIPKSEVHKLIAALQEFKDGI